MSNQRSPSLVGHDFGAMQNGGSILVNGRVYPAVIKRWGDDKITFQLDAGAIPAGINSPVSLQVGLRLNGRDMLLPEPILVN